MNKLIPIFFACTAIATASMAQHNHAAHTHGAATAEVSVNAGTLTIAMEIPMESLLGFEHAARTASERQAVAALQTATQKSTYFVSTPPAAGCTSSTVKVESAVFTGKAGEHSDLDATLHFQCSNPAALNELRFTLFEPNKRLKTIKVELVTPRGQKTMQVRAKNPVVRW